MPARRPFRQVEPTPVAQGTRAFVVGITGHRDLKGRTSEVSGAIRGVLERLRRTHGSDLVALSALASGADTLFAEAALDLGVPLEVVLPFREYADDFGPGIDLDRFEGLLARARQVRTLPFESRSDEAYAEAGRWVVDHCDLLVAAWDGRPARGLGGTGDVVRYAIEKDREVIQVTLSGAVLRPEEVGMEERIESIGYPEAGATSRIDKFEEYKFFAQSTQDLADRRQTTTQVYLTVTTLLFAVMGFLLKDPQARGHVLLVIILPLLLVGLLACVLWRRTLISYRALIAWRFDQLMEMERSEALGGAHRVFVREWEDFFGPRSRLDPINFTRLEAFLPLLLGGLYLALGTGLLVAVFGFGWRI